MIINCCFIDAEGTRESSNRVYVVRYMVETNVPYETNALITAAQAESECVAQIGESYPGIPPTVAAAKSAVTTPDDKSFLTSINAGKRKVIEAGKRYRYVLTLNYQTVISITTLPPLPGEESCDPVDWCPLYRERVVPRTVEATRAIFAGMQQSGEGICVDSEEKTCGPVELIGMAPIVDAKIAFKVEVGDCVAPVNTAGNFITGITRREGDVEISMTRWYHLSGIFQPAKMRSKQHSLNASEVNLQNNCWGSLPLVVIPELSGIVEADWLLQARDCPDLGIIRYWEVNFTFLIRTCGWIQVIRNDGLNRLGVPGVDDDHGGEFSAEDFPAGRAPTVPITKRGNKGYQVSDPVPLDKDGQPIDTLDPDDVIFTRWRTQDAQEWDFL